MNGQRLMSEGNEVESRITELLQINLEREREEKKGAGSK
jgi:hypothetical protein